MCGFIFRIQSYGETLARRSYVIAVVMPVTSGFVFSKHMEGLAQLGLSQSILPPSLPSPLLYWFQFRRSVTVSLAPSIVTICHSQLCG